MAVDTFWLERSARPLRAWLHAPAGERARGAAVLCPPFVPEYLKAHCALRLLGEALEEREIAVLRLDYDGTGDSAGSGEDPDRLAAWLASVSVAVDFVRDAGAEHVSLIGMRIGATLAAQVAAERGDVDNLVLWDPCLSGRQYLREQQVLGSLLPPGAPPPDGSIDVPGLRLDRHAFEDVRRLRLDALARPAARHVLVMTRPDRDPGHRATAGLGRSSTEHAEATGQEELLDVEVPWQRLPRVAVGRMAEWLSAHAPTVHRRLRARGPAEAVVGHDGLGRPVVERSVRVPPSGLVGIWTELDADVAPETVAVFLNVATEHHLGPARLWVDLARRWAAAGIPCLRVDLSGVGESPTRPGGTPFLTRPPEWFDDVEEVVRLAGSGDARRVVLVGLCASAYQALDSALALAPAGVVALNPVLSFVPPELAEEGTVDSRRICALPRTRVVGAFHDDGPLATLRRVFQVPGWKLRLWSHPDRRPSRWLDRLVEAGTDVLVVAGPREARPFFFGTSRRTRSRLTRTGRFRLEYQADLQHGLLVGSQREAVADLVTEHVLARFAPRGIAGAGPARAAAGTGERVS